MASEKAPATCPECSNTLDRGTGSCDRLREVVGELTIRQAHVFTNHYETASWYRKVRVEPSSWPIVVVDNFWFVARMKGIVESSYFIERLGASYGPPKIDEDKGRPATTGLQWRDFDLGQIVGGARPCPGDGVVTLEDGWRVLEIGAYSDGSPMFRVGSVEQAA